MAPWVLPALGGLIVGSAIRRPGEGYAQASLAQQADLLALQRQLLEEYGLPLLKTLQPQLQKTLREYPQLVDQIVRGYPTSSIRLGTLPLLPPTSGLVALPALIQSTKTEANRAYQQARSRLPVGLQLPGLEMVRARLLGNAQAGIAQATRQAAAEIPNLYNQYQLMLRQLQLSDEERQREDYLRKIGLLTSLKQPYLQAAFGSSDVGPAIAQLLQTASGLGAAATARTQAFNAGLASILNLLPYLFKP